MAVELEKKFIVDTQDKAIGLALPFVVLITVTLQ